MTPQQVLAALEAPFQVLERAARRERSAARFLESKGRLEAFILRLAVARVPGLDFDATGELRAEWKGTDPDKVSVTIFPKGGFWVAQTGRNTFRCWPARLDNFCEQLPAESRQIVFGSTNALAVCVATDWFDPVTTPCAERVGEYEVTLPSGKVGRRWWHGDHWSQAYDPHMQAGLIEHAQRSRSDAALRWRGQAHRFVRGHRVRLIVGQPYRVVALRRDERGWSYELACAPWTSSQWLREALIESAEPAESRRTFMS